VTFYGHLINILGIRLTYDNIAAMKVKPNGKNVKDLQTLAVKTMSLYNKTIIYRTSGSMTDKTITKTTACFYVTDTHSSVYQAKILFAIVIGMVMLIEIVLYLKYIYWGCSKPLFALFMIINKYQPRYLN
jgi:hypothetical protein